MLEKFIYENSLKRVLEFGKDCLFVNENDLRDFAWEITSRNNRITGFKKGIVQKTIPVILKCSTESEGVTMRNHLFEVFERDVLAKKHGRIYIGDYYLRCFITGAKKSEYLISKQYMVITLTVQTDYPMWVKETFSTHLFEHGRVPILDYSIAFPYDFTNPITVGTILNSNISPCDFLMTIYGEVVRPTLYIDGHLYSVDVYIEEGEYLTIDSRDKTIILTKTNGEKVNCFNDRDRDSYIFEKIPTGNIQISSPNDALRVNIILFEERSEPKWI